MFDEYVEHASAPAPGSTLAQGSLPPLQYEGFEPSPYDQDDTRADIFLDQVETAPPSAPIFQLGEVQCPLSAPILSLVISSDTLYIGLATNLIIQIELSRGDQFIRIQIPRKPTEFSIHKLFLDPSGRHLLVTSLQGENWYFYKGWKKPRQLKSFKMVIESVAWNKAALLSSSHSTSTREMLIGARNGTIYEAVLDAEEDFFKSQERYLQPVFTLPERHPVTGLKFDMFPPLDPKRALILVTTATRIYQFVGIPDRRSEEGGRVFSAMFASYRDTAPKIVELPGSVEYSELHVYSANADQAYSLPRTVAWMNAAGIYHGNLDFESSTDDLIDSAQLLPYPAVMASPSLSPSRQTQSSPPPISMSLTEFHFLLLYRDRVLGISNLNEELAYEELLPLKPNEQVRGLTTDPVRKTYWVYTDQSIWEIGVTNEHRDVWKIYLNKGIYDAALQYANSAPQRDQIVSAQAQAFFKEGRYFQAAQCYAQCSVSFEKVTLQFLDAGERDALRSYLISRLERTRKFDLSQRMMLATWLVEFYLSKCNELDDLVASESVSQDVDNLLAERAILEDDLRHFFETYKSNLDPKTVYELIQGHGRTDMYLHYATAVGDFERVVEHWIMEEEWAKAIDVVNRQSNVELYYRFAPVLMRHAPKETVDSWLRRRDLDPLRLVPALLRLQHVPRDPLSPNHAVRYLNHVVFEQGNTSRTIHNLIITFYASTPLSSAGPSSTASHPEDDGPLLRFLSTAPSDPSTGKPYYDLDYALRLCKQGGRIQPCVHIYSKMGLWENSVDLALEKGDLELAKINADMPEDDEQLRKKLWLKIAKYVVQDKQDIKMAMRFLENTDLLKIEDILPFFPDFVVIDDFKEEICTALEGYSAHIDALKADMDDATKNAEAIRQDIAALQKRFITVDATEKCSSCALALMTRQFYVFPCHHTFHADCLIGLTKEFLPAHALRRILALQTELMKTSQTTAIDRTAIATPSLIAAHPARNPSTQRTLLSSNFVAAATATRGANAFGRNILSAGDRLRDLIIPDALANLVTAPVGWIPGVGFGGGTKRDASEKDAEKVEQIRRELEDLLAASCPMCESVVAGIDKPFVQPGEVDGSWDL
ncbi:Pep3/Vps18/deep orange family-domain-containing protein [Daedaleopsis nitida]|nr:Pep3/Vps18/deep orange family-domain-containing protein [Daedaleopsis nitida]